MTTPPARLYLFGGARLDGSLDGLGRAAHRRRLALLAILAASPRRSATRERVIGLLWADTTQEKARRALSEAIYVIRRDIGEGAIETEGLSLRLGSIVEADVLAFRSHIERGELEDAVALRAGAFLEGWYVDAAVDFDQWADEERRRLDGEYRTALSALANQAEERGEIEAAIRWLRRLVDVDPLGTRSTLRLARLLHVAGERAEALVLLERHKKRIDEDLGVAAADDLLLFEAELREAEPVATVTRHAERRTDATASSEQEVARPTYPFVSSNAQPTPEHGPRRGRTTAVGIALGAIAISAAWYAFSTETAVQRDRHRIAVLYFDDHSAARDLGHVADGITEALIHELAGVPALRVSSRNAVKPFRTGAIAFDSIASRLNVGTLVEGSVQRADSVVRVTAQVIDANTGVHDTSLALDGSLTDLLRLEEDLATAVAAALRRSLGEALDEPTRILSSRPSRRLTREAQALHRQAYALRFDAHGNDARSFAALMRSADSLLARAEALEPGWPTPRLLRAQGAYEQGKHAGVSNRRSAFASALHTLSRISSVQGADSSDLLFVRGAARWGILMSAMDKGDDSAAIHEAERDLRAAVAVDSVHAPAWAALSELLLLKGAYAEAHGAARRALDADPYLRGAEATYFQLFVTSVYLGRFDEANRWCLRGQVLYPRYWRFYECELTTMRDREAPAADAERAWKLVAIMDTLDPPDEARTSSHPYSPVYRRMMAAAVSARNRDTVRARATLADAHARVAGVSELELDLLFDEAYLLELLSQRAQAVAALRRLMTQRPFIRETLLRDPFFSRLRDSLLPPLAERSKPKR